ncbi:MAG TPA: CsbD family protein [Actinomycetes bacterium]|nr:CsbD family protein [Actinomycetes bacterium]
MGTDDKMRNQGQIWKGRAKESAGKITDNERLEREGRTDQAKGQAKSGMEKLKDAFGSLFGRRSGARRGSGYDDDRYRGSL